MKFAITFFALICLTTAAQGLDVDHMNNAQLSEILSLLSARAEKSIKSDLPGFVKEFRPFVEATLHQFLIQNRGLSRIPILPPLPESISLPDLRLIKFDFEIFWGNTSFWDHNLDGLNTLTDNLVGEETPVGEYKANYRIDIGKLSFNGMYDIEIIANLSTGEEGSIDDPIGLTGHAESFLNVEDIFLDLDINFGKQPDSELVKVDVGLALGSGNVSVHFQNLTLSIGEFLVIPLPVGVLDPIVTPIINNVLGLTGPLIGEQLIRPILHDLFQECTLQEIIDFFTGAEGADLTCAFPATPTPTIITPETTPAPTEIPTTDPATTDPTTSPTSTTTSTSTTPPPTDVPITDRTSTEATSTTTSGSSTPGTSTSTSTTEIPVTDPTSSQATSTTSPETPEPETTPLDSTTPSGASSNFKNFLSVEILSFVAIYCVVTCMR